MVDSADPDRFNEARNELGMLLLLMYCSMVINDDLEMLVRTSDLRGVPFLFFVNKQDLGTAMTPVQVEELFNTQQIMASRPIHVQPLTAINGYSTFSFSFFICYDYSLVCGFVFAFWILLYFCVIECLFFVLVKA